MTLQLKVRDILTTAAEWRLISMLLERPKPQNHRRVTCIATEVGDPYLQEIAELFCHATEENYLHYFGPGGLLSPREVAYIGWTDPGKVMSEIRMLYGAFSFEPRSEDPFDHLAVEADFISYLYIKEAYALLNEEPDKATVARDVSVRFVDDHFGVLISGLRRKLTGNEPAYILKTLIAVLMRAPARKDARRPGLQPGDFDDDPQTFSCA